ncbi:response regulator [Falsihalocynthiibacter sp. SS001]|uniref:response regulator n=1 Tax=Falsihalocynthiibacter sp. SS001 TaxID=3349698 RepID=UPI0036D417E4
MLIKFSILWVEDSTEWYEATLRLLKRYLEDLGFHLDAKRISDPENEDWDHHFENTSQYDLMLIDWRIHGADHVDKPVGGDVISKIREHIPYSDIIFYSGDSGIADEVKEKELQGVYTSMRGSVREDAEDLINHLLHKTLHPKIMRGVIVSSLSQIDEMCFKIIERKYQDAGCDKEKFATDFRDTILKQAERQLEGKQKKAKKDDDTFISCLHSTMMLDSFQRATKVVKLSAADLKKETHDLLAELPDTIRRRNWLAHWKHLEENDEQITLAESGKDNYVFDLNEAARMRRKINEAWAILSDYLAAMEVETVEVC